MRLTAPPPAATVRVQAPATVLLDGTAPPPIPVPDTGSFALATSMGGTIVARDAAAVRPIGSVAKAMTALVVLSAHPLGPGGNGPSITMTSADVPLYRQAVAEGGSNLRVRAGEVLTERDLLLALLLPSADNIAETLAVWVSGNRAAFIARLNATAAALGMPHTHFADPSGLSVRTVSTAADLVALARAVIANPALADLVGTAQAALPDGTVLNNLDILLNRQPGWLGIKTGWTGAAGGCLLFADEIITAPGRPSSCGAPSSASHPQPQGTRRILSSVRRFLGAASGQRRSRCLRSSRSRGGRTAGVRIDHHAVGDQRPWWYASPPPTSTSSAPGRCSIFT